MTSLPVSRGWRCLHGIIITKQPKTDTGILHLLHLASEISCFEIFTTATKGRMFWYLWTSAVYYASFFAMTEFRRQLKSWVKRRKDWSSRHTRRPPKARLTQRDHQWQPMTIVWDNRRSVALGTVAFHPKSSTISLEPEHWPYRCSNFQRTF